MIKRLRRKFVLIMMSVVAAILLIVFFAVLRTTQGNIQQNSVMALRQTLRVEHSVPSSAPKRPGRPENGPDRPQMRIPTTLLLVDEQGVVTMEQNSIHFLAESDAGEIARQVLEQAETSGVLESYNLRYLVAALPEGKKHIALVDTSMESNILRRLILDSMLIGGGALLLFLGLSIFLARWAVHPVQQAWDRQRQFVADASHELKTPLTVILSNADMLAEGHEFAQPKEACRVENIQAEGRRMKRLVEDMLTLAGAESAEPAPVTSQVDLGDVITGSILLYEPLIYDKGLQLEYHIAQSLYVRGDSHRLQQVADALLDNAIKYCPKGKLIRVGLEEAGKNARLSVFSQGQPIPKEAQEAVFDRFYRLDPVRSGGDSFGLGLSIAQSIVAGHGGKIWIEAHGVEGNTFLVSLPLVTKHR